MTARRWLLACGLFLSLLLAHRWLERPIKHEPGILASEPPLQEPVSESTFGLGDYRLTRRARFQLRARVLSVERYWLGREADLAPLDLALGWGVMSDEKVLERIDVHQGSRWYFTRFQRPAPVPETDIVNSSGNMHMIPASRAVGRRLNDLRRGHLVRLVGYLVDVDHPSGWQWRTSLRRDDSGAGACEIFYVEEIHAE
jgi:hypothetical protein